MGGHETLDYYVTRVLIYEGAFGVHIKRILKNASSVSVYIYTSCYSSLCVLSLHWEFTTKYSEYTRKNYIKNVGLDSLTKKSA